MVEMVYLVRTMFNFDIRDLYFLGRNLDELKKYAGDKKWRVVKDEDGAVLDYHGDELLSKTYYIEERAPQYFKAKVIITGLEASPFDLRVSLETKGTNKTIVEYKTKCDLPPDFDRDVIWDTIDEFRKNLFDQFSKAAVALERDRRKLETSVPYEDIENNQATKK